MKAKCSELSRLYHEALRKFLKRAAGASLAPARALGRQAITLGLETLDLARIHESAIISLVLPHRGASKHDELMSRAAQFFTEALTPIEETHRGVKEANTHLNEMIATLSERTQQLAASVEELKQEIAQRTAMEESLRLSQETSGQLLERSREMQEELRLLSRKLLTAQEEERRRISRELHDVIAQTLTGINVRLAALKAESTASGKGLQRKISSTQRLVEKSVDVVHRFARELRPTVLDDLGLIPALKAFLQSFLTDTGLRVSLKTYADIEKADGTIRTVLYRICQEALNNVARHAHANKAEVNIQKIKGVISMEIKDEGSGFVVDGSIGAKNSQRLGLLGMRERVEMIGGTFCVESAPGKGTRVRVEIPASTLPGKKQPPSRSKPSNSLKCP